MPATLPGGKGRWIDENDNRISVGGSSSPYCQSGSDLDVINGREAAISSIARGAADPPGGHRPPLQKFLQLAGCAKINTITTCIGCFGAAFSSWRGFAWYARG